MALAPSNLLADESSPYLRQHAGNPVHWRGWNAGALAEARELNRPILLSVGYAACHWCHVMAHECFEDAEVADVMNQLFVNIKVDREERPDVDQVYMAALTAMGEQGGWPLTMFLTPDAKSFWGGTYFPKAPRYGRPGFIQVLEAVATAWGKDTGRIVESADRINAHIASRLDAQAPARSVGPDDLSTFADAVAGMMDTEHGSLRGAPKFPNAPFLHSLWLSWLTTGTTEHRDHVLRTLENMLRGGIYDHVGGGLARYSTDAEWIVPHFEKMLYDNAQLIRLCNWAYAETGMELFRRRIEETIAWLSDEMTVAGGGFASSLDADSEGEEGLFYTWTEAEISDALGDTAAAFSAYFSLTDPQGWEGKPILLQTAQQALDSASAEGRPKAVAIKTRLQAARARRVRPGRDDKVLTDWNGLAIAAIAEVARVLGQPAWLDMAEEAYAFVLTRADADGRLPHSILGEAKLFPALSTDYAAMTNAAVSLYEATGDKHYLDDAGRFVALLQQWHHDSAGGHYLTASDAGDVPIRIRGDVDEAIPSATGQIIEALTRFATIRNDTTLLDAAWTAAGKAMGRIGGQPYGQAGILNGCAVLLHARKLIVVDDPTAPELVPVTNRSPDPRRVDVVLEVTEDGTSETLPDGTVIDRSRPAAYLCEGLTCRLPVHEPEQLAVLLKAAR